MANCPSKLLVCSRSRKTDGQQTGRIIHIWFNQSASRGGLLKYQGGDS